MIAKNFTVGGKTVLEAVCKSILRYAPDIAKKTKWFVPAKPIAFDDLVFISGEKNKRGTWSKGSGVHIRSGNQVRCAVIQTISGLYT